MSIKPISQITSSNSSLLSKTKVEPMNFNSIWGNIDVNCDGQVSPEEAKKYGFNLFSVEQTISRSDFEKQFNQRQRILSENTNIDLTTAFSRVPYAQRLQDQNTYSSVIQDINLTPEEQRSLLEQMNGFTMPSDSEFEKNKKNSLYFDLFDNYEKFKENYTNLQKQLAEDIKVGRATTISNRHLAQILSHIDTTDTIQDGKIGSFAQGQTGDCWFLSMLANYAENPTDESKITDRIKKNEAGYEVTLQNPLNPREEKVYSVTIEDLKNHGVSSGGAYSSGDLDVRILEIAMTKMLKNNGEDDIAEGTPRKQLLVHRALGYTTPITHFEIKNDGIHETIYNINEKGELSTNNKKTNHTSLQQVLEEKSTNSADWLLNTDATSEEEKVNGKGFFVTQNSASLQRGHVSNLSNIETGEDGKITGVTINEPYMSNLPLRISVDRLNEQNKNIFNPTDGRNRRIEGIFTKLIYIPHVEK